MWARAPNPDWPCPLLWSFSSRSRTREPEGRRPQGGAGGPPAGHRLHADTTPQGRPAISRVLRDIRSRWDTARQRPSVGCRASAPVGCEELRAVRAEPEYVDHVRGTGEPVLGGHPLRPGLHLVGGDLDRETAVAADQVMVMARRAARAVER